MKVCVRSENPEFDYKNKFDFSIEMPDELTDEDELNEYIYDKISDELQDCLRDTLWEMYSEILDDCPIKPMGYFAREQITEIICNHAKETIEANRSVWTVECSVFDDTANPITKFDIELSDILLTMLEEDSITGEFATRLGSYVESSLRSFVDESTWHIEENQIWFGIDGKMPLPNWSISSNMPDDALSIWFNHDSWTLMSAMGDFDDGFLVWYTVECLYWAPNMDEIRELCPIPFDSSDTVKSLFEKVTAYREKNK